MICTTEATNLRRLSGQPLGTKIVAAADSDTVTCLTRTENGWVRKDDSRWAFSDTELANMYAAMEVSFFVL